MRNHIFQQLKQISVSFVNQITNLSETVVNNFSTLVTEVNNYFSEVDQTTGFVDSDSITLSFNNSTRTFTITPVGTSFVFWSFGTRYEKFAAESIQIADTPGVWYFYYDSSGVLGCSLDIWNLATQVPIGSVLWDSGAGTVEPEPEPVKPGKSTTNIYTLAVSCPSTPTDGLTVLFHVVVGGETIELAKNLPYSYIKCGTASTGSSVFDILINGTSRGSATIAAGQTIGSFTWTTKRTLSGGDIIKITAPATADATMADIGITIRGTRT